MSARSLWRLLPLLGLSSCVVPGLEVGSSATDSSGALSSGGTGGAQGGTLSSGSAGATGPEGGTLASSGAGMAATGGTSSGGDTGVAVAGSGGLGQLPEPRCEDFPIPPKSTWVVAASSSSLGSLDETDPLYNPPDHVIDGDRGDRWASGQPQEEGQWFHIDFGVTVALSEVTLQQGTFIKDYPRGYEISVSYRHTDFDAVASASGHGASVSETVIPLDKRAVGRYMLIRQTGSAPNWWSIAEISVACH